MAFCLIPLTISPEEQVPISNLFEIIFWFFFFHVIKFVALFCGRFLNVVIKYKIFSVGIRYMLENELLRVLGGFFQSA